MIAALLGLAIAAVIVVAQETQALPRFAAPRYNGLLILLVPLMGLFAICRGGKWHWKVIEDSKALNAIVWIGWITGLVVGMLTICGL
jgi:hypothetical protein